VSNEAQPTASQFERLKIEKSIGQLNIASPNGLLHRKALGAAQQKWRGTSQVLSEKHILQGKRRRKMICRS
jgi:hypothetical protein